MLKKEIGRQLKGVILFMIITLGIHFAYRFWWIELKYWPIHDEIQNLENWLSARVYHQGTWIVTNLLGIKLEKTGFQKMIFSNQNFLIINNSCSGFKQIVQFVLLLLIYPGPWKHKAWIIPSGMVIIHFINLVRVSGLAVMMVTMPQYWEFSHDYVFRPLFYLVIFLIWVIWEERFRQKKIRIMSDSRIQ